MKALILLCLSVCAAALRAQAPDSLTTEKYINRIFVAYPDSALALIERDAARPKPQIADFKADMLRAMCYEVKSEYATKTRYCLRALQHDSVRLVSRRRLRLLGMTASALSADGKQEECIAHCRQAIELARQLGNRKAEAGTLITMGRAHTLMKQTEQALAYYREAAALLEGSDDVRELAELSTAYGECMTALLDLGQTAEAIATGKRREALIARMSEMAGPPAGYIDQQYGFVRAKLAYALQRNGQQAEAAEVYRRFEGTRFAQTLLGRQYGTAYLQEAGRHREALALTEECVQRMDTDTLNQNYLIALNNYAQAYRGMKQYAMADGYAQRYIALQETLHTRQMESRAQEYATLFSLGEKELELSRSRALSERKTLMLIGAAVATSLLIIIIVIVGMNLHKTRKKNRVIARQIDELLHSRDALRQAYSTEDIKEGTLLPPLISVNLILTITKATLTRPSGPMTTSCSCGWSAR